MSSWRKHASSKSVSTYTRVETPILRTKPSGITQTVFPISYRISKSSMSCDVVGNAVRFILDFGIEPLFSDIDLQKATSKDSVIIPIEPVALPIVAPIETATEPVVVAIEPSIESKPATIEPVPYVPPAPAPTHTLTPVYSPNTQMQVRMQPNTVVGIYNNMQTGVVSVIRSPRFAKPYH